ncbi:MAG: hypothetical protein AAB019_11825, partial [Planctomycetota bacterium]
SFEADFARGDAKLVEENSASDGNGRPSGTDLGRPNTLSLFDPDDKGPGTLYPDGAYSEWKSCPSYNARDNFVDAYTHEALFNKQRFRGTVSFWVKLNYWPETTKPRILFSASKSNLKQKIYPPPWWSPQGDFNIFALMAFPKYYPDVQPRGRLIWFWDIDATLSNVPDEYIITNDITEGTTGPKQEPKGLDAHHQWMHVVFSWDTNPPTSSGSSYIGGAHGGNRGVVGNKRDTFALILNGTDPNSDNIYQPSGNVFPPIIRKHLDFVSPFNLIRLGERHVSQAFNTTGDFTIDEFTIQLHNSVADARIFALEEYREGRYYKGEGEFTSKLIEVPLTTTLVAGTKNIVRAWANWTVYYPANWDKSKRKLEVQFFDQSNQPLTTATGENKGIE